MTPNFKKIILLSNESNDITINNLIPNAIVKFHNNLVNNSIFYWNVDQIFIKQKNIMIKTKNNTLLNTKLFVKEFPNLSYGLIFIIHIEKILSNEFKIILDKDLKINGYSDESNLLKRDTYDNYGLVQNCIGIPICSIIPEIVLYLTNNYNDKDKENNDDKEREIILKNKIIIQRGNLYEYKISSLNKKIIDKSFDVLNHIKKGDSKKFDIISKMKEKQKEEIKDYTKTISDTSLIFTGEKSLSKKYTELLAEIENNAFKKVKIEYEIIERSFLNNKYKYYLLTIRKDIYNYDYEVEENNANNNEKITSSKNVLLNTTIENNFNFKKNMEKQIKLNNDINKNTNLNNKKEEENNPQQDIGNINEKDKQNENGSNRDYVLKTVKENGKLLEFADETMQDDREIALEAVKNNPEALEFVSDRLKEDREIVYESVSKLGWTYCYARGDLLKDRELLMSGLKITGQILYYSIPVMRDDKEVVKLAVENKPIIIKYASKRLKNDKELGLIAMQKDKSCFKFLGEEFKLDEEIKGYNSRLIKSRKSYNVL